MKLCFLSTVILKKKWYAASPLTLPVMPLPSIAENSLYKFRKTRQQLPIKTILQEYFVAQLSHQ